MRYTDVLNTHTIQPATHIAKTKRKANKKKKNEKRECKVHTRNSEIDGKPEKKTVAPYKMKRRKAIKAVKRKGKVVAHEMERKHRKKKRDFRCERASGKSAVRKTLESFAWLM